MNKSLSTSFSRAGKAARRVLGFGRRLIEPSKGSQMQHNAERPACYPIFLICLFLLFLAINLIYWFTVPGYHFPIADVIGYGILALTYVISHTRFTGLAVTILLLMFPLNVFQNIGEGTSINLAATLSAR
jgi:hypothetical protein